MKRLILVLMVLLTCVSLAWSQGQLINGHRTMTGGLNTGTTTGSGNAYVLTLNPPLPGYVTYQCFTFLANHTNTGAATLNVNAHGTKAIKKWSSSALVDVVNGEFTAGQYVHVCYDGTVMQVQSGSGGSAGGAGSPLAVLTHADSTPVSVNSDLYGEVRLDALSQATVFAEPTGTPVHGQTLRYVICTTEAQALTFTADPGGFGDAYGLSFPTLSRAGGCLAPTFHWNAGLGYWELLDSPTHTGPVFFAQPDTSPITINTDLYAGIAVAELSQPTTFGAPTGSPTEGQDLSISLCSTVPRALTFSGATNGFGASYGLGLPTTSPAASCALYRFRWRETARQWLLYYSTNLAGDTLYGDGVEFADGMVKTKSTAARFVRDLGTSALLGGSGNQGQMGVLDTDALCYTGGSTTPSPQCGFLAPLPWNLSTSTCNPAIAECKVTVDAGVLVLRTDSGVGGSPGDVTAVGGCATGACGTVTTPLTGVVLGAEAAYATPAAGTARFWLDSISLNLTTKNASGTVLHMVKSYAEVAGEVLVALAADGTLDSRQLASTDLSDTAALARLTGPQTLTSTVVAPRYVPLAAASGSVTPNADTTDIAYRLDLSGSLSLQAPAATGANPRDGQILRVLLKSAAPQALTWASGSGAYAACFGRPLPTTTTGNGTDSDVFSFLWHDLEARWCLLAATKETASTPPKLVTTLSNPASVAPNVDTTDEVAITALAQPLALGIPTGTPADAKYFVYYISSATAQPLTWDTGTNGHSDEVLPLPTTTVAGKRLILVLRWNVATAKWALVGSTAPAGPVDLSDPTAVTNNLPLSHLVPATTSSRLLGRGSGSGGGDFGEVTLGTNLSMSGTTLNAAGGGGTGTIQLSVVGLKLAASNTATPDVSETNDRLLFDASTEECGIWQGAMPADYVGSPVAKLNYSMTSATSGGIAAKFQVMAVTGGDAVDVNTESYDTENVCTDTVAGTAGHMKLLSCALTNFDSAAIRDLLKVRLCRKISDAADTATGDMEALTLVVEYQR